MFDSKKLNKFSFQPSETTTSVIDDGTTISDAVTSTSDTLNADVVTSTSDTSTGEFVITSVCIAVVSNAEKQFRFNLRLQGGAMSKLDKDCSARAWRFAVLTGFDT